MTHYQKLNQILHGLLHVHKIRLEKKPLDKKLHSTLSVIL